MKKSYNFVNKYGSKTAINEYDSNLNTFKILLHELNLNSSFFEELIVYMENRLKKYRC